MPGYFTYHSSDSIWNIGDGDGDGYSKKALEYLNDPSNFRPFSQGLTEFIKKCGYNKAEDDIAAKTNFILSKLSDINVPVSKSTVKDWFSDKRRPALVSNSRTIMFQLCFALNSSFDDVKWFFNHIYFDKSFNCHTKEEAVYYYCFRHGLPYSHALSLISEINSYKTNENTSPSGDVFTKEIKDRIDQFSSDGELLNFFKENNNIFLQWNKTALTYINKFVSDIQGRQSDRAVIEAYKNGQALLHKDIANCSLIIQEYLHESKDKGRFAYIHGKNITSISFMLERITSTDAGISKETDIPGIVKLNFPSKKTFSDIINKSETSTSYDSIRKCLVLLKFYHFWVTLLLNPDIIDDCAFDIYCEETNALLDSCGYEELFPGNPYDWLFLWAATTEKPLTSLRDAISGA